MARNSRPTVINLCSDSEEEDIRGASPVKRGRKRVISDTKPSADSNMAHTQPANDGPVPDNEENADDAATTTAPDDDKAFQFMGLAAELRNHIYELLLQEDEPVRVMLKTEFYTRIVMRRGVQRNTFRVLKVQDPETGEWYDKPPEHTAIISVNKQVYREASTILYGSNTFSFASTTAVRDFIPVVGGHARYIRKIIIEPKGYFQTSAQAAFDLLKCATSLKSLQINHRDLCDGTHGNGIPMYMLRGDFKGLIKSLKSSCEEGDEDLKDSILDVIKVQLTEQHPSPEGLDGILWSCGCIDDFRGDLEGQEKHDLLNAQVRSLVTDLAGLGQKTGSKTGDEQDGVARDIGEHDASVPSRTRKVLQRGKYQRR